MAGGRLAVAAFIALAGALSALFGAKPGPSHAVSPFGGPVVVHVARVGRIEVDLESSRRSELRRIPCAGALPGTGCYVASSLH